MVRRTARRDRGRLILVLSIAVFVAGCTESVPSSSDRAGDVVYVPVYRPLNAIPMAIIGGRLTQRGQCLLFESPHERSLPLWPLGTQAWTIDNRTVVGDDAGHVVAVVGDVVHFGGGTSYPLDWAEKLVGASIPADCQVGDYTIVNSLTPTR